MCVRLLSLAFCLLVSGIPAAAQTQGSKSASSSEVFTEPAFGFRVFGSGGYGSFSASDSFDAVFGSTSASSFGFGAELRYRRLFVQGNWEKLGKKTGERVLSVGGETIPLGIEDRLEISPWSVVAGYRFLRLGGRTTLLAGVGIGGYGVKEDWDFALPGETVDESFTSYHGLLGVEFAVLKWVSLRAEFQYTTVPDSAGDGGVSETFGETDLGGPSFRIKLLAGR
jgi:opacity protein-like surface antigen